MQNSVFNNLSNLSNLRCLLFIYLYFFCFFFLCISKFSSFKYNLLFFFVTSSVTFFYFFNISHFVWKFLWQRQISLITFYLFVYKSMLSSCVICWSSPFVKKWKTWLVDYKTHMVRRHVPTVILSNTVRPSFYNIISTDNWLFSSVGFVLFRFSIWVI